MPFSNQLVKSKKILSIKGYLTFLPVKEKSCKLDQEPLYYLKPQGFILKYNGLLDKSSYNADFMLKSVIGVTEKSSGACVTQSASLAC